MKMNDELKNELCFTLHEAYDKVFSPCGPVFPTGLIFRGPFFCQVHRPVLLGLQKKMKFEILQNQTKIVISNKRPTNVKLNTTISVNSSSQLKLKLKSSIILFKYHNKNPI